MRATSNSPTLPFKNRLALLAAALIVIGVCLPLAAWASADSEMTFQAVAIGPCRRDCATAIAATGQITREKPQRFLEFLRGSGGNDLHAVVFLDSPGGGVLASMEFGTLLRRLGAAAVVGRVLPDGRGGTAVANGRCFSACVYALIGARRRVIPNSSEVGIHRMFLSVAGLTPPEAEEVQSEASDASDMRAFLTQYTRRMGVSPALIAHAERIPSQSLHILSRAEIRRWHLGVPTL